MLSFFYHLYKQTNITEKYLFCVQGVLGIKVKIMLDWDPTGKLGPKTPLPDNVIIHMPKDDVVVLPPKEVEEYRPPLVVADEPLPMPMPMPVPVV